MLIRDFKNRKFYTLFVLIVYIALCNICYSQIRYPRYLSNGFDTLEVNKQYIIAKFDTTVTYSDLRTPLKNILQLSGFDSTYADGGDTLFNTYLLKVDSGLTNLQYKNLIIHIRNTIPGAFSINETYGDNADRLQSN